VRIAAPQCAIAISNWPPKAHWGVESQVPWLTIDDDLPHMRTEDDPDFVAAQATVEPGEG
jgi:hypothetical protein